MLSRDGVGRGVGSHRISASPFAGRGVSLRRSCVQSARGHPTHSPTTATTHPPGPLATTPPSAPSPARSRPSPASPSPPPTGSRRRARQASTRWSPSSASPSGSTSTGGTRGLRGSSGSCTGAAGGGGREGRGRSFWALAALGVWPLKVLTSCSCFLLTHLCNQPLKPTSTEPNRHTNRRQPHIKVPRARRRPHPGAAALEVLPRRRPQEGHLHRPLPPLQRAEAAAGRVC